MSEDKHNALNNPNIILLLDKIGISKEKFLEMMDDFNFHFKKKHLDKAEEVLRIANMEGWTLKEKITYTALFFEFIGFRSSANINLDISFLGEENV